MNPAAMDPLAQLRDIHLPDGVAWWPPAPGWWLLLLLLAVIGALIWRYRQQQARKRRYRVLALQELELYLQGYRQHGQYQQFAREVSELLKRVAIHAYPTDSVAGLSGAAWVEFLNGQADMDGVRLPQNSLDESLYQRRVHGDAATLHSFAVTWIERHREVPDA